MANKRIAIAIVWFKWRRFIVWHDGWFIQFELGPLIIAIDLTKAKGNSDRHSVR